MNTREFHLVMPLLAMSLHGVRSASAERAGRWVGLPQGENSKAVSMPSGREALVGTGWPLPIPTSFERIHLQYSSNTCMGELFIQDK